MQRFLRKKKSQRTKPIGTEVGLLIAKTIIETRKGSMKLESSGGGQTTFEVSLPLAH